MVFAEGEEDDGGKQRVWYIKLQSKSYIADGMRILYSKVVSRFTIAQSAVVRPAQVAAVSHVGLVVMQIR